MITRSELLRIARARLFDAEVLLRAKRYDGAVYICGYAVEIKLKARICKTQSLAGFPSHREEARRLGLGNLLVHDLDLLLELSCVEKKIKLGYLAEWSAVASWDPSVRYKLIGSATKHDAELMIESTKELLRALL